MKKLDIKNRGVRANCNYCQYGGEVENFMHKCSSIKLNINHKRSAGYRKCQEFKLDDTKYGHYA